MAPKKAVQKSRQAPFTRDEVEVLLEGVEEHQAHLFGGTRGQHDLKRRTDIWTVGYTVICIPFVYQVFSYYLA